MGAALRLLVTLSGHWLHTGIGSLGPSHRNQFFLKEWYHSWRRVMPAIKQHQTQ
jgi:hypothetical protein